MFQAIAMELVQVMLIIMGQTDKIINTTCMIETYCLFQFF